jgi:hypothetical protein
MKKRPVIVLGSVLIAVSGVAAFATVTIQLASQASPPEVQVPLGALLDDGRKTAVRVLDSATSTVRFRPIKLVRLSGESAVISGLSSSDPGLASSTPLFGPLLLPQRHGIALTTEQRKWS